MFLNNKNTLIDCEACACLDTSAARLRLAATKHTPQKEREKPIKQKLRKKIYTTNFLKKQT